MANATFRLPSKFTQWGYVEVSMSVDETDPAALGATYTAYVRAFQAGEKIGTEALKAEAKAAEAAPAPAPAPAVVTPPVSIEQSAAQLIESELGGKVVAEETAPWNEDAPPKAEPWKNSSTIEDLFAQ